MKADAIIRNSNGKALAYGKTEINSDSFYNSKFHDVEIEITDAEPQNRSFDCDSIFNLDLLVEEKLEGAMIGYIQVRIAQFKITQEKTVDNFIKGCAISDASIYKIPLPEYV